jgi:magnesium chelatase family protein
LGAEDLRGVLQLDDAAGALLQKGAERFELSGRALTRTQKVARTLADLAGSRSVSADHVATAFAFRGCVAGL